MSYTFSWGSLLQNQWIDRTALSSAIQSFIFYSITNSNQPTSSPNFDITSNHFLTKNDINNFLYSPQFTSTGIDKLDNQYISVKDLVPQSLTFSIYTGFSSPSIMLYNDNDNLIYVGDNDAGNISSYNNGGKIYNLTYSNIYSFNPLQLGTSSYVFGPPLSTTGITLSFYGTISMPNYPYWSYLNDYTYETSVDNEYGLLFLTGYSQQDNGGLRIFDINTHELITIPYGINQPYCRLSFTLLNNNIFIQSFDFSGSSTFKNYYLDRPKSGLSMSLYNQLSGLTSSLEQIYFDIDYSNSKVIVDAGSSFIQIGNYICTMGTKNTASPNIGIYNYTPIGNTYSLYTIYSGTSSVNFSTAGTNLFITKPLVVPGYNAYGRGFYLDKFNNRLYVSDSGNSCLNVLDVSNADPKLWVTLFTIFINAPISNDPTTPSTISLSQNLGKYNTYTCYGESRLFNNPNNLELYLNLDFVYNLNMDRVFTSLNIINKNITYAQLLSNINNFISNSYNNFNVSNFISANGFNLYGCNPGQTIWDGGSWSTDGTFTKYGLNITGLK